MRINPVNNFSIAANGRRIKNNPEPQQTSSPMSPSFKGSSLGGSIATVSSEVATTTAAPLAAFFALLFSLGTVLAMKADEDIREGKYDSSDIYGDRGERDRMYQ